jgi:hypothetical protein
MKESAPGSKRILEDYGLLICDMYFRGNSTFQKNMASISGSKSKQNKKPTKGGGK